MKSDITRSSSCDITFHWVQMPASIHVSIHVSGCTKLIQSWWTFDANVSPGASLVQWGLLSFCAEVIFSTCRLRVRTTYLLGRFCATRLVLLPELTGLLVGLEGEVGPSQTRM